MIFRDRSSSHAYTHRQTDRQRERERSCNIHILWPFRSTTHRTSLPRKRRAGLVARGPYSPLKPGRRRERERDSQPPYHKGGPRNARRSVDPVAFDCFQPWAQQGDLPYHFQCPQNGGSLQARGDRLDVRVASLGSWPPQFVGMRTASETGEPFAAVGKHE